MQYILSSSRQLFCVHWYFTYYIVHGCSRIVILHETFSMNCIYYHFSSSISLYLIDTHTGGPYIPSTSLQLHINVSQQYHFQIGQNPCFVPFLYNKFIVLHHLELLYTLCLALHQISLKHKMVLSKDPLQVPISYSQNVHH